MDTQQIIDEFFVQDGSRVSGGRISRSKLLAIIEDMKFCILLPGKWRPLQLNQQQNRALQNMRPSFTIALLFCAAVDLLGKVVQKRRPPRGQNRDYFVNCAVAWFHFSDEEANQFWSLRNALAHQYSLSTQQIMMPYGHSAPIHHVRSGYWVFYLHAMYSRLIDSSGEIYDYLSHEPSSEKQRTRRYLSRYGFFYTI